MEERVVLGLCDLFGGLVLAGVCVPLVLEKIPPNQFYGFRISPAFRTEEAWYDINRFGGWQMICWSTLLCISGGLKTVLPWDTWFTKGEWAGWLILFGPLWSAALMPAVITIVYAIRYDRQHR